MKMFVFSLIALSLTQNSFCKVRGPASFGPIPPSINLNNFLDSTTTIVNDVEDPAFNSQGCVAYLRTVEEEIDKVDVRKISMDIFKRDAQKIVDNSWKIRHTLHKRLDQFDANCIYQIQSSFRQFRFIEDYIMEKLAGVKDMIPDGVDFQKEEIPMMAQVPYYLFLKRDSDVQALDARGGDIFITRGLSFLSAMIARLGTRGTQFSHIVFVHENPSESDPEKKLQTIESYVGSGVAFYDFKYALKNENARILWLRPKDHQLASKASSFLGDYIKNNRIHYDYQLDFDNHETMSCAEVSQFAYEKVSDGKFHVPFYPNEIVGAETFLEHIGMKGGETFEPGDMEIDPRFELMGEFKDLRLTRDSRQKDAILSELFRWMNEKDYILYDSMKSKMAGGIIYDVRRTFLWPLVRKALGVDDFSKEIPRKMLRTVTVLNQIGAGILAEVREKDVAFQKETGWPMTYHELYKVIENFRKKDLALYSNKKTRKQSLFHAWFRPKDLRH